MLNAGTATASLVLRDYAHLLARGVVVFAGSGNNGGDAYVVAAQLARAGVRVRVVVTAPPRTDDAQRAAAIAREMSNGPNGVARAHARLSFEEPTGHEQLVIDGLLGTGHRGALREPVLSRLRQLQTARDGGALVVALDIPSGLDASTGDVAVGTVSAHVTSTYASVKRGALFARAITGRLVLHDIGVGAASMPVDAWDTPSDASLAARTPHIAWNAHKGQRAHLALVGGVSGMAGAIVLAARGALASGVGLTRAFVDAPGVPALQHAVPQAIARSWEAPVDVNEPWGHALAIGPGLGRGDASERVMRRALDAHPGRPVVLDADALTLMSLQAADNVAALLCEWCGARDVVCTPHPGEFARISRRSLSADWSARVDALTEFAARSGAVVLLKGTPTMVAYVNASGSVQITVVPRGSALLATGGSGDVLTGVIGALLAQGTPPTEAAVLGATAHGLAGELVASSAGGVRGPTLDDVLAALPRAWSVMANPSPAPPHVLGEWPSPVGLA